MNSSNPETRRTTKEMFPIVVLVYTALFGATLFNEHALAFGSTGSFSHSPGFRRLSTVVIPISAFLSLIFTVFAAVAANGCRVAQFSTVIASFIALPAIPLLQYLVLRNSSNAWDIALPLSLLTITVQTLITIGIAKLIRINSLTFVPPCVMCYTAGAAVGVLHMMTMNE